MKLYDAKHGHEVGVVKCGEIVSRHGDKFSVDGFDVIDAKGDIAGTFDGGSFVNVFGETMAVVGKAEQ